MIGTEASGIVPDAFFIDHTWTLFRGDPEMTTPIKKVLIPRTPMVTFSAMRTGFFFLGWCFFALACQNPFSTRKPEQPVVSRSNWIPPVSPDKVLVNLQSSVAERNTENYIRCLADPSYSSRAFRFNPNPETASNHPGVFLKWGVDKEQTVVQQAFSLVPPDSACFLTWTKIIREITSSDTAILVRQYRLEIHHKPSDISTVFEGHAEFRLASDQRGEWIIYLWTDNSVSGSVSWSDLKATLGG